ncbi:MAG: tetratricopeptide repeat protein [Myxococcota bacterium]
MTSDDRTTLEDIYKNVPRWAPEGSQNALVRVLSTYARTAPSPELQTWLNFKNGILLWKTYNDAQMAEMAFRKVENVPNGPDHAESAKLLRTFYTDFYTGQNNWRRLEQVLSEPQKGGFEDPVEVKRILARLAEDKDQADKAVGFWQGVRQALPDDIEAETALTTLYEKVGKWHAMVDLLKERLDRLGAGQVAQKTEIHRQMIDIYKHKMQAPAKVVASWQSILEIDPGNDEALDALAAEYTEMKRWPDLVKVLQQKVEHEKNPKKLVDLHKQIAQIMIERFSNTSEAIKSYEAILHLEPTNREAIKVLKDIYDQRRDYDSFVAISEREIGLVEDTEKRHKQLIDLAKLASEKLRKPQTPIALWERVLEHDSHNIQALTELESWFEREKNWVRLSEILEQRVALERDVPTQVNLLDKLGVVASTRLNDQEKAADVWRQILTRDKEHRKAQTELKKKYIAEHDWEGLEWFFRNYGDVNEWVRTLESQVKSVEEPEERTTLLYKAAAIWRDELKDTRRAVKNLEAVLELEPRHADTARMLIPIYKELGSWKDLPNVYEIVLDSTEDPYERRDLLLALAEVHETKLDNVEAAFFAYVQAVSQDPGAVELHPKLRELADLSNNWESYVYTLQDGVDYIEVDKAKVDVLLEIGHVFRDKLGAEDQALGFFNRVLTLDPYNRPALDAAERAFEAQNQVDQLVLCYQKRLTIADSSDERLATLFKLARVWREQVQANDEAEAVLLEMLEDFPTERRVHDQLIEIYLEEARYAELRDILERKRDVLASEPAISRAVLADIECQLGMLTYGTVKDDHVSAAVDRYEVALSHAPNHTTTVERLEELLADEGQRLRITKILAPVYDSRRAWSQLSQMLEIQVSAAKAEDDAGTQLELRGRLADLYKGELADADLAWRTYGRLFALRPEDAAVRAEFERLTAELDRWQQLVHLYTTDADTPVDRGSRLAIKLEIARTWHKRLTSLEDARVFYQKVRDEEPEHKESIDALEEIYVDLDRSEDLLEIYRGQIDLSNDVQKKLDYLFRTSDLLRERLERHEDAIAPAQEALSLSPGNLGAIQRLDDLFTHTEKWEDLAQTLEDTIRLVQNDKQRVVQLKVRLAGVYEKHLERPETAIALYAEVFQLDAQNQPTVDALERLFENDDLAPTIAPILQPYYEKKGDWQRLVDVYVVREQAADLTSEKVDWNYKIAELYEQKLGQPEQAFNRFESAANLDPGSEITLSELLRLGDELENHGELILFLQSIVDDIPQVERRIETHRTIALLARDKTHDLEGAEKQFRAILDINPNDMPAVDALIALYREAKNDGALVEMLLKKAPMDAVSSALRNDLYAEAGEISASRLQKPEQAIEIYETLHGFDAMRALDSLERLYEKVEDWDSLVRVYREKIERASDIEEKKHYAALMGHVQAKNLEATDDAIATWHLILGWDPTSRDALDELDGLYSQQGDWFNLQTTLRKVQALPGLPGAEWSAAQFRIAKLYEDADQLGNVTQAVDEYGALLAKDPTHQGAVESLEAIIADRDAYEKAFGVLRPVLEQRGNFEELWEQYEVLAAHQSEEPDKKVATLHEMADVAEIRLSDSGRALDAQARAFAISPRNTHTVGELERIAEQYNSWEDLVRIYAKAAEGDDEMLALDLRLKAGAILMDRIGDPVRATEAYKVIYKDHPEHAEVLGRLHRLYEQRQLWPELAQILRAQADTEGDTQKRIAFLEKLAKTAESKLKDSQKAYEAYIEILDLDRTSPLAVGELRRLFEDGVNPIEIAERLEPIYRDGQRWEELDSLLQTKLIVLEDPVDRMQLMRDLALLALDKRNNEEDALEWYGQAFQLDPEDDGLLGEMERLAGKTGAYGKLAKYELDAAEIATEADRKVQLWHKAAAVSRDQLAEPAEAERIFRLVLDASPEDVPALRALDQLLVAGERWDDLEPVLVTQTKAADLFDDERIVVWTRLAELYRDRLDRRADAVEAWKQVLELQDMHEPALKALQEMYVKDGQWAELFDVLQRLADLARDPNERVAHLADMANIAEQALDDPKRAIELWEDVLSIRPDDVEAVHELQRLLQAQADHQALSEAYERELRMGKADAPRRLELFKTIGRLWQAELDDPFQAQGAWERARNEEPFDREALDALRGLHLDAGNDQARAEILEAAIASEKYDQEEELGLWRELAIIRTDVFGDQTGAIEAWRAVTKLRSNDGQAIDSLEQLYEATGRWQDLVDLYLHKLDLIEDPVERIETWLLVGTIYQDNLSNTEAAAQTYRDILAKDPSQLEASRRLEAIYEQTEQWPKLAELLLQRNDHLADVDDKLLNLQRLAVVHEQRLNAPEDAFLVLTTANELVPEDAQVLGELERLGAATGNWKDLYDVYEATLEHLEGDAALELMVKSAAVQKDKLGSRPEAIRLYERVLMNAPEHEVALRNLVELNEAEQRWPALVETLYGLAEVTPDYGEKDRLYRQIAGVQETKIKNLDLAVKAWGEAHDLNESDKDILDNLERLHIARRDWESLIANYDKRASLEPDREVELRLKIAGILEGYVKRVDDAIQVYEDVLGLEPGNATALGRLEALYGDREDYQSLLDVYERAYDAAQTDDDRLRMAKNAAILHDAIGSDPRSTADAWQRVLRLKSDDTEAFDSLVKLYTDRKEWDDLVRLYELRYETADTPTARADAILEMARLYQDKLDDVDNATQMYERVLLERRGDRAALDALDSLYERQGLHEQVLENIERKLEVETDTAQRVAMLCRQGEIASEELNDNYRATASYTRVLKEQPGNPVATEALIGLYRSDERWDKVVETLQHKLAHTKSQIGIAAVHVDMAEVYAEKLSQPEAALEHFESAEKSDPESRRALEALADHYMKTGAHAQAMTRLEALVDKLDEQQDRAMLAQVYKKLGLSAEALYLDDQALESLEQSSKLVPPDQEALKAISRLHYKKGNYREAERSLTEVLEKYKKDLTSDEQVKLLMQLGESALKIKNIEKAQTYLKQVVAVQPHNPQALENIIETLRAHGDWQNAVRYQESLLSLKTDKLDRYRILLAMGDTYLQEIKDRRKAAELYRAALDLDVFPKAPALKLVELCLQSGEYDEAIRNLNRLIKLEDEPKRKAQFAYMAAVVYRDQMKDPNEAIKYFNLSLDHNLENLQAFRIIDELLTAQKEWKGQEQNYRRMIQRVTQAGAALPQGDQLLFKLYEALGEIYRSRLKKIDYAISSFELAREKKPDEQRIRETLASLYEVQNDSADKAIKEHRWLIAQQPNRYESYHKLVELFKKAKQPDAAWNVAGLLIALQQANDQEKQFYRNFLPAGMAEPTRVVDQTLWMQCVMSRQEDPELGRILELIYLGLGKNISAQKEAAYGLKKKQKLELTEGLLVANTIRNVLKIFGMASPEIYKGEEATGIEILQTNPPKMRLGTDMLQGRTDKELAFHIAKKLTYFQPAHIIATLYPREALENLYLAGASLVDPNYQIVMREDLDPTAKQAIVAQAAEVRAMLEKTMAPELKQQLAAVMRSSWKRSPVPDLGRWHRAVELTAQHAGLVACGDPALTLELIKGETVGMSKLKMPDKLKDHVMYVVSEQYFQLRKQLGLQIEYSDLLG